MDNKIIFPAEVAEFTAAHHLRQHYSSSKIIYQVVLCVIVIAFISLFFIKVNVSVTGMGLLTSANERNMIKAPVSGRVDQVYVKLNQQVQPGEVLFTVQTDILDEQSEYLSGRRQEMQQRIADLQVLTAQAKNKSAAKLSLRTPVYIQQYTLYKQQLAEANLQAKNATTAYQRNKILHEKRVLSDAEFDKFDFEHQTALAKIQLLSEQQFSQWHSDLVGLRTESMELRAQQDKYTQEKQLYVVKAPIKGSIQQFTGILPGSFVSLGETVAEISPDSGLIATVSVAPKDIGLLQMGMSASYQVDAFNYNEWGKSTGSIIDISRDVHMTEKDGPFFQVKCSLDKQSLYLSNGYEGKLKKGMSFQARFQIARRTLFQLLYDKVDNWLNPAVINRKNT